MSALACANKERIPFTRIGHLSVTITRRSRRLLKCEPLKAGLDGIAYAAPMISAHPIGVSLTPQSHLLYAPIFRLRSRAYWRRPLSLALPRNQNTPRSLHS